MCLYKYIIKRFPLGSYWYWDNPRFTIIIRITDNKIIEDALKATCVKGNVIYEGDRVIHNNCSYVIAIKSLHPLTKKE